jgi:type II secretory pathway pseudopilin PulG
MRIRQHAHSARRPGFTLIEMMVSTALVMMIMLIISQALGAASKTFTTLRTAGALQERARTGITLMRRDLASDKFGPPYGSARGGPKVSDQRLDQAGWEPPFSGYFEWHQDGEGPVRALASILEPFANPKTDGEGITSTRAVNHWMRFTVRLPDGPQSDLFAAQFSSAYTTAPQATAFVNPQQILYSRWAEVVYWLDATGTETTSIANPAVGMQLFTLRRRIRLLPPANVDVTMTSAAALQFISSFYVRYPNVLAYPDVVAPYIVTPYPSANVTVRLPGPEALNNPDVDWTPTYIDNKQLPQYVQRLAPTPRIGPTGVPTGDDIVMTDVISLDIKAAWFNNATFNSIAENSSPPPAIFASTRVSPNVIAPSNLDEPFSDIYWYTALQPVKFQPPNGRVFDTGTRTLAFDPTSPPQDPADWDQPLLFLNPSVSTVPNRINVRALQIKIRIWDPRAEQARQVTIVQEV